MSYSKVKCWLTVKGAKVSAERNNRPTTMPVHLEGMIVDMEPHYEPDKRFWMRVEWTNKEFGTYYSDEKTITIHKPKSLKAKRAI